MQLIKNKKLKHPIKNCIFQVNSQRWVLYIKNSFSAWLTGELKIPGMPTMDISLIDSYVRSQWSSVKPRNISETTKMDSNLEFGRWSTYSFQKRALRKAINLKSTSKNNFTKGVNIHEFAYTYVVQSHKQFQYQYKHPHRWLYQLKSFEIVRCTFVCSWRNIETNRHETSIVTYPRLFSSTKYIWNYSIKQNKQGPYFTLKLSNIVCVPSEPQWIKSDRWNKVVGKYHAPH